jgi:hypothetical protein
MPKRSGKPPSDPNKAAAALVARITGQPVPKPSAPIREKNPAAQALGRLGGLKGGNARRDSMTPEERKESARKAAEARWGTKKP